MLAAMQGIVQKIEQQEGYDKARPLIGDWPGREGQSEGRLQLRPKAVRRREDEGGEDGIEEPDADIAEPPPQRRKLSLPARPTEFPQGDGKQAANEHDGGQGRLPVASNTAS